MRKFKKKGIIKSVLLVFAAIFFAACGKSSESVKIGFLYSSEISYRFFMESIFFAERARELGAEVIIDHANDNDALQHQKALEMVNQGIDILVLIYINANTADAIVRDVKNAANIPVIAYNRLIPNSDIDMFIAGNNQNLGEEMAGFVLNQKPQGNYMIFGGDKFDRNAVELQASIDSVLKPSIDRGDINIIYRTFIENWNGMHAAFELRQYMANFETHPDVIISGFDGMSESMIEVLEEYGLAGDVIITGQDAQEASVQHILDGKQHLTLYHPWREIAYTAAEVAIEMARGNRLRDFDIVYTDNGYKQVPTVQINSIPVTIDNINEVLFESGAYNRVDFRFN
ncbi:substrate-binding domain-containing protein [Natronoflexus pectinivorans]|uniref:D-xylose transport system substrate-binding protein n=1 Tax=Natronoflexus pectinivorans TaxID=682526 RepID=A0A4R2GJG2_9BACT|nr:substrate-binding domain-containing protein [Natronoflexus pectinivorans]TCO08810.1 D-xylose transport system substrate-binding protein [Natronoflexus pectinivorans]